MNSISSVRFLSLLITAVIANVFGSAIEEIVNTKNEKDDKSAGLATLIIFKRILFSVCIYILLCLITTTVYAFVKSSHYSVSFFATWANLFTYYIWANLIEFLIIPLVMSIITMLIGIRTAKIKLIISAVLSCVLVLSPLFVNYSNSNDLPMGKEIMTELRSIPFPYEGRIFDIEHFKESTDAGYRVGENQSPTPEPSDNSGQDSDQYEFEFTAYPVSLTQYINNVVYFERQPDPATAKEWLQSAYAFFLAGGSSNENAIGRLWFYKGRFEDPDYFLSAAAIFKSINENYSVALSYGELFENSSDISYAQEAMEYYVRAVSEGDNVTSSLFFFKKLIVSTYDQGVVNSYIHRICNYAQDDAFLNALDINASLSGGYHRNSDIERLNHLLSNAKFKNCPKLLVMQHFYNLKDGIVGASSNLYQLYEKYPSFFETEDRINLAWILYDDGEYVKAYELLLGESENCNKDALLLLKAEAYLQNEKNLSEIDEEMLYQDISTAIDEAQEDSVTTKRLRLSQCVLAGKIGIDPNYSGLSDICLELFGGTSPTGLFVVASLSFQDGHYADSIDLCDEIARQIDTPNYFYNKVQFLKVDAILQFAKSLDPEERQKYYNNALEILAGIEKDVGNDYIKSLEKSIELYKHMEGKDAELQDAIQKLTRFK